MDSELLFLAEKVVTTSIKAKKYIAAAESCTGGLISAAITAIPGSSQVFWGGITAYANQAKVSLLGVSEELLKTKGAVSAETVRCMALSLRKAAGADIAVSVSGIAGPGGGSEDKPVGTVWLGISCEKQNAQARTYWFSGNRGLVRRKAAQAGLQMILTALTSSN